MLYSAQINNMKILDVHKNTIKPQLYEKGNAIMWTDKHISEQLLNVHLNTEIDLASRRMSTIESTIKWILENVEQQQLNILDLGCGPGFYSEKLANLGHKVTGIDFSENSIQYAKKEAIKKKLDITFLKENYLNLNLEENSFDLVILIFTDFGPLLPYEREQLLIKIKKVLKPNGIFIFDVLNDKNIENKIGPKNWEIASKGFWKNEPYLALSDSFYYENNKVILFQHQIIDSQDNLSVYRFWTHFFSHSDLSNILNKHRFINFSFHENVLPKGDFWTGENVTFCKAINNK